MKENISTAGVQQYFSIRAQCIRSDSASRPRRHAGDLCKIILEVFGQKGYQQFRLKKSRRCRSKTFSGYKRRESRVQRHAAAAGSVRVK